MPRAAVAIITGACGGMGRAITRELGREMRLVITDTNRDAICAEADALRSAGHEVAAALRCDVADPADLAHLLAASAPLGPLGALVHTAGLSPALAGAARMITVNLVATAQLLDAFLGRAVAGSAAICIASMAAYLCPVDARLDAALAHPDDPQLLQKLHDYASALPAGLVDDAIEPHLAYAMSKRGVMRLCERRSALWAQKGARIMSLSPGMIDTPMGRAEVASNPKAAQLLAATPLQRWGMPADIAKAVAFLCSDAASFITGCDIRVDGGLTPLVRCGV